MRHAAAEFARRSRSTFAHCRAADGKICYGMDGPYGRTTGGGHWAPAHTSGGAVVFVPAEKIVFAGDLLTEHSYPLIHLDKNGSSDGWIKSVKGIIAFDADTYITGHGTPQTKADVQKELAHAEARKTTIKKMIADGKSLQDIKDALSEKPQPPAAASDGHPPFPTFTETTYLELTAKKTP